LYHREAAKQLWQKDEDCFVDAGKELRTGAGIFDFISKDLIARWAKPPENRPPELIPKVQACLTALYLADAQRVAIAKALRGESSALTIAKLLIGCAERYEMAGRCLQSVDKETFDSIVPGLLEELGAYPAVLRACAANCLAQHYWGKKDFARGYAHAIDATQRFKLINMGKGLKETQLQHYAEVATARTNAMEREYQNDCENVYYEKPSKDLRVVEGQFIITIIPYELPVSELVSFAEVPLKGQKKAMKIQNFWSALWAKPIDYPQSKDEHVAGAVEVSGAMGVIVDRAEKLSDPPKGVDPEVFANLPAEIQQEIKEQRV